MAYLGREEEVCPSLLLRRREGYSWPPSSFPQWRVVKVAMAYAIIF